MPSAASSSSSSPSGPPSGSSKSEECYAWKRETIDQDDLPPDYAALVAMIASIVGVTLKHKIVSWIAIFGCLHSIATLHYERMDLKQIICCALFATSGLALSYFAPPGTVAGGEK